jgi:hypothetical protein
MHAALNWIFPDYLPPSFALFPESVWLVTVSVSPTPSTKAYDVQTANLISELHMKLILLWKLKPSSTQDLCQCYEQAAAFIFAAEDGSIRVFRNIVLPHRKTNISQRVATQPLRCRSVIIHEFSAV